MMGFCHCVYTKPINLKGVHLLWVIHGIDLYTWMQWRAPKFRDRLKYESKMKIAEV